MGTAPSMFGPGPAEAEALSPEALFASAGTPQPRMLPHWFSSSKETYGESDLADTIAYRRRT